MARNDPQINIRIPAELKARLERNAANNGRTLTAEIVHQLLATSDALTNSQNALAESTVKFQKVMDGLIAKLQTVSDMPDEQRRKTLVQFVENTKKGKLVKGK